MEGFTAPTITVDRVVPRPPIAPEGQCGESDYRVNSVECGQPAQGPVADAVGKGLGTVEKLLDPAALKTQADRTDMRFRMLQEAELKALRSSALYKKLEAQTKDPERVKQRAKEIEELTSLNDQGAFVAPWSRPDDPAGPPESRLRDSFKLPSLPVPQLPQLSLPKLPF